MMLYHAGGASDVKLLQEQFTAEEWSCLRSSVIQLLQSRNANYSAQLLETIPFVVFEATNGFNDEFSALHAVVPFECYTELVDSQAQPLVKAAVREIAETITEIGPYIRFVTATLDTEPGTDPVSSPSLQITSDTLERALADAEQLIHSRGAASSVDRVHTVLHAYLRAVCNNSGLSISDNANITHLFKVIREQHPAFQYPGPRSEKIDCIVRATATILDALNPLRNHASLAHPNEEILDEPEAMLVVNSIRTLLHYLDRKINQHH